MKITYDEDASAMYVYFVPIGIGGAVQTKVCERMEIDFDVADQITTLRLYESKVLDLRGRLKHVLVYSEASFDQEAGYLHLTFSPPSTVKETIVWHANLDLDEAGQVVGIEILFTSDNAELPSELSDSSEAVVHLRAGDRLRHVKKYLVDFDEVTPSGPLWLIEDAAK